MWIYIIVGIALVIFCAYSLYRGFFIEPKQLRETEYAVSLEGYNAANSPKRLAFISDLHVGKHFTPAMLGKAVTRIMASSPDLILIGGDFVEEKTPLNDPDLKREYIEQLSRLKADFGVYAVLGNHDAEAAVNLDYVREILTASNISLLRNETVELGDLLLTGLDESFYGKPDISAVDSDKTRAQIILMHQPDPLPREKDMSPRQLVLSGHTHNGQVTLFGLAFHTVPDGREYVYGHYRLSDGAQVITSAGLGTVHIYARYFNLPEIVTITLN